MDDKAKLAGYHLLKSILTPYRTRFTPTERFKNGLGFYALEQRRAQVAIVFSHPRDLRIYFLPLRAFPDLRKLVPASLARKIVSKSVFVFKTPPTVAECRAFARLLIEAVKRIEAVVALAPKLRYVDALKKTAKKR